MSTRIRKEEYTALGDFIKTSFVRDQVVITTRFPKLDAAFLADFTEKLEAVKSLESGLLLTEEQKAVTVSLYAQADALVKELSFLSSYLAESGLDTTIVSDLRSDLQKHNIEGAIFKIESLKQFVTANLALLVAEGMVAEFPDKLDAYKIKLAEKNALQNSFMNDRKALTDGNKVQYDALYDSIAKIMNAGKLVFDGTVKEAEYSITRTIGRMRAPQQTGEAMASN